MQTVQMVEGCEFQMGWRFKINSTTPKDLTGYSVLIQIRPFKTSPAVLGSWNESSPYVTFTPATGAVDLNLPPSVTNSKNFKGVIDCWVYNASDTDGDRSETYTVAYDTGVSRL